MQELGLGWLLAWLSVLELGWARLLVLECLLELLSGRFEVLWSAKLSERAFLWARVMWLVFLLVSALL